GVELEQLLLGKRPRRAVKRRPAGAEGHAPVLSSWYSYLGEPDSAYRVAEFVAADLWWPAVLYFDARLYRSCATARRPLVEAANGRLVHRIDAQLVGHPSTRCAGSSAAAGHTVRRTSHLPPPDVAGVPDAGDPGVHRLEFAVQDQDGGV